MHLGCMCVANQGLLIDPKGPGGDALFRNLPSMSGAGRPRSLAAGRRMEAHDPPIETPGATLVPLVEQELLSMDGTHRESSSQEPRQSEPAGGSPQRLQRPRRSSISRGSRGIPSAHRPGILAEVIWTTQPAEDGVQEARSSKVHSDVRPRQMDLASSLFKSVMKGQALPYFAMWFLWLIVGTVFYHANNELTFAKGFYMAVNIGYSIGFGWPSEDASIAGFSEEQAQASRIFSCLYVIIGASFVGLSLGFFGEMLVQDRDNWYQNAVAYEEYTTAQADGRPCHRRALAAIKFHWIQMRLVVLWFVWMAIGAMFSGVAFDWPLDQALYFAVSSCSTGGHWSIPREASDTQFFLVGVFAALGTPLMGAAMASLAALFISSGSLDAARAAIGQPVTLEEIDMMKRFGLADDDDVIDQKEYLILCMVRTGVDPGLVSLIAERFVKLDNDKSGDLQMVEILDPSQVSVFLQAHRGAGRTASTSGIKVTVEEAD